MSRLRKILGTARTCHIPRALLKGTPRGVEPQKDPRKFLLESHRCGTGPPSAGASESHGTNIRSSFTRVSTCVSACASARIQGHHLQRHPSHMAETHVQIYVYFYMRVCMRARVKGHHPQRHPESHRGNMPSNSCFCVREIVLACVRACVVCIRPSLRACSRIFLLRARVHARGELQGSWSRCLCLYASE